MDQLKHFGINKTFIRGDTKSYNDTEFVPLEQRTCTTCGKKFKLPSYPPPYGIPADWTRCGKCRWKND